MNLAFVMSLATRISTSLRRRLGEARAARLRASLGSQVRALDSRGVSIVSNNCVAGILYEWAGVSKQSPTAGIYFAGQAYKQFLDDLAVERMQQWLDVNPSKLTYRDAQRCWALPVGSGGQLVFLHYPDAGEATDKWKRRTARLRGRTPLIICSMRDGITADSLAPALGKFRFTFRVNGDPAAPADELVVNPKFLRAFADYLDHVLRALPAGRVSAEMTI